MSLTHGWRKAGRQVWRSDPFCQGGTGRRSGPGKGAAHTVFTAHPAHAKPGWIDRVRTPGGDVAVAVLAGEDGQRACAQEVVARRGIVAGDRPQAGLDPVLEPSGCGQKRAEENQLTQRRDRRGGIPFNMKAPRRGSTTSPAG